MNINEIKEFLLLCVILNYVLLLIWAGVFIFAHDWMYKMHGRWFRLSAETFDAIHYKGMCANGVKSLFLTFHQSTLNHFFSPCRSMDVLKNINRLKFSPRLSPGQTVPDLLWLLRSNSLLSIKHQEKYHRGTSRRWKNPEQAGAPNDSTYF